MDSSGTDTFSIEVTGRGFHRRRGESAAPPVLTARLLPARDEAARSARSLRLLYLFRAGFSAAWVALVISLTASPVAGATLFDIRATPAAPKIAQYVNLAAGIAAAAGVLLVLFSGPAGSIAVFGGWAVLSGATMVIVAMRRRRTLGGQWLLIISGAGSIFAGITSVRWAGSPAAGLATLAQYSAGGAFWYLLAVLWLLRSRRSPRHPRAARPRRWPGRTIYPRRCPVPGLGRAAVAGGVGPRFHEQPRVADLRRRDLRAFPKEIHCCIGIRIYTSACETLSRTCGMSDSVPADT